MSEPKKPKIKIGTPIVHPRTNAVCVPYEYDTGERGLRNFTPEQFNTMNIEQVIREHYEETQRNKQANTKTKIKQLEQKEIDW